VTGFLQAWTISGPHNRTRRKASSASWIALTFKGGCRKRGEEDPPQCFFLLCGQQNSLPLSVGCARPCFYGPSPQREEVMRGLSGVTRKRQLEGRNGMGCNDDSRQSCPHPPCQVRMLP